jgi:hypothetical protein
MHPLSFPWTCPFAVGEIQVELRINLWFLESLTRRYSASPKRGTTASSLFDCKFSVSTSRLVATSGHAFSKRWVLVDFYSDLLPLEVDLGRLRSTIAGYFGFHWGRRWNELLDSDNASKQNENASDLLMQENEEWRNAFE